MAYDIIGDIHGHCEKLEAFLASWAIARPAARGGIRSGRPSSSALPKAAELLSARVRELADLLDRRPPEETTRGRSSDLRHVGAERPGARGDVVEAKAHAAACCT